MAIKIYNTLSKQKEVFTPMEPGTVRMYVCGPTVYDSCHIGHARCVVVFDVVSRYLKSQGYDVTYVRNFTDIDDKIIKRANEMGIDTRTLSETYINEFYHDMDALYVERATLEPKATAHISDIIKVVRTLEEKGLAYAAGGDVFFRVNRFEGYGKLSGRKLEDMLAGARIEVDENKEHPMDFVLWKKAKIGEPSWNSPWGAGRPGWHIECTAMSSHFLGESFDIHGGGKDLIFPHHENEIAQSEAAFGKPFARYWMHNGFVNINKEKMSKSLNNFLMIKDVLKTYHPETVRLFLLSNHYRSPIDFTEQAMDEARIALDKIYTTLGRIEKYIDGPTVNDGETPANSAWTRFAAAMDDDFNTALGIGVLFETVRELNRKMDGYTEKEPLPEEGAFLSRTRHELLKMGQVLGILRQTPESYFEHQKNQQLDKNQINADEIDALVKERTLARREKNWARADEIRDQLQEMNIVVEDRADGPVWKVKD